MPHLMEIGWRFAIATTVEFLRDYGVGIRTKGDRHWPNEMTALIVAKCLKRSSG
jgi:transposase